MIKRTISIFTALFLGANLFAQSVPLSITDGERRIYYDGIADAEAKILKYYEDRLKKYPDGYDDDFNSALPYEMFTDLILHDPRAFDYDFERLLTASANDCGVRRSLRIVSSPDKKIKLYTWDEHGGTMTNYSGITSIAVGNTIFSYSTFKDEISGYNEIDEFVDIASGAYEIDQFIGADGEPVYIIYSHSSGSSIMQLHYASLYQIRNGLIVEAPLFEISDGMRNDICVYFDPRFCSFSEIVFKNGEFLLPESRENDLNPYAGGLGTGRSLSYKWNGQIFKYNGVSYSQNEGLNTKLLDYYYNVIQIKFDKWTIRIDKMNDGSFRYASWKTPKTPDDIPDLVVKHGYEDIVVDPKDEYKKKFKYIFQNNGYFYIVSWVSEYSNISSQELVVKNNDKILMHLSE